MSKFSARNIAYTGVIAALYATMTIGLAPLSYGVYQVRLAEVLTVLPFIYPLAMVGLFIGCLVANIFGGNGLQDIIFGSLLTLLAGYLTYAVSKLKSRKISLALAPLPPVIVNAFGVAIYLSQITDMSYLFVVQMIGIGQLIACYGIGLPFLIYLLPRKNRLFKL